MRFFLVFLMLVLGESSVQAKLKAGASTEDVAAIIKAVAGEEVDVFFVAKGTQDPHQIEAKPSYMVKFRDADLIVSQGLELESAWLIPLIRGSRNPKIVEGSRGFLELGSKLDPIEVAKNRVSRAEGDVHPEGNPHFQLDPLRVGKAALLIAERLGELDSSHHDLYSANAQSYQRQLEEKTKQWKSRIEKSGVKEFVSYHRTFSYFADRFGLRNTLYLEPKPGIPPTAGHLIEVLREMKKQNLKLVLIENYFDDSVKEKIISEIPDAKVLKVPVSVGGDLEIKKMEDLYEALVKSVEAAK